MSDQRDGGISWTDETWNPIRGCSRVSEGCRNCYAEKVAARFSGPGLAYEGLVTMGAKGGRWNGTVRTVWKHMFDPLRWRRPRRVFVNSMSDLFHESLSDEDRDLIFAVMLACEVLAPRNDAAPGLGHTFQVLTKRSAVMRRYLSADPGVLVRRWAKAGDGRIHVGDGDVMFSEYVDQFPTTDVFPLRSVWLGVSAEDQATADERLPDLVACPAAVRWVSYEPAIGPIDFGALGDDSWLAGVAKLDWVVVGGESGPGARPFDLAWARSVIRQCEEAGTACFVKQLGAVPYDSRGLIPADELDLLALRDRKGGDMAEWPEDLRVRQWPGAA